jgi:hypothetical protein
MERPQRVLDEITAFVFRAWRAECKVREKLTVLEKTLKNGESDSDPVDATLQLKVVCEYHEREKARKASIEEKAKKNLFAVTVATGATAAGIGLMTGRDSSMVFLGVMGGVAGVALLIGVVFLLVAALTALHAMRIGVVYDMTLEDEAREEGIRKALLLQYIGLNQLDTTVRSNWVFASDACIRNGLLALAAFALLTVAVAFLADGARGRMKDIVATARTPSRTASSNPSRLATELPYQTRSSTQSVTFTPASRAASQTSPERGARSFTASKPPASATGAAPRHFSTRPTADDGQGVRPDSQ